VSAKLGIYTCKLNEIKFRKPFNAAHLKMRQMVISINLT